MTTTPAASPHPPRSRVTRWGPWVLAVCGLALLGVAGHHVGRYKALDAEFERKLLEEKQAREAMRRAAAEAGDGPAGALLGMFAASGGSAVVDAVARERLHHGARAWQSGGPGAAVVAAGLAWAWVGRRLRRAAPEDAPRGGRAVMAVAAGLVVAAAGGLFFLHLDASNVDQDEAVPALVPWWLAAAVGAGFAVYLARPARQAAGLLAAVVAVAVLSTGVLYTQSSDAVGVLLGYGTSTARRDSYLLVTAAVALATVVFLRAATPRPAGAVAAAPR